MPVELATWREKRTYQAPWGFELVDAFRAAVDHDPPSVLRPTTFLVTAIRNSGAMRQLDPPLALCTRKTARGVAAVTGVVETPEGRRLRPANGIYAVRIGNPAYQPSDHEIALPYPPENLADPQARLITAVLRPGLDYPFPATHNPSGRQAIVLFGTVSQAIAPGSTMMIGHLPNDHPGARFTIKDDRAFLLWFRKDEAPSGLLKLRVKRPRGAALTLGFELAAHQSDPDDRAVLRSVAPDPLPAGVKVSLKLTQF